MFTGIVKEVGRVARLEARGDSAVLTVAGPHTAVGVRAGDSVCVNGVCLTVTGHTDEQMSFDVMAETLERTCLGQLTAGDEVNLEAAMRADGRFGGHVVQGHVDGTAQLVKRADAEHWRVLRFGLAPELAQYVAMKGAVAVHGVSLTVSAVSGLVADPWFEVSLIPTTLANTVLGRLTTGDVVNIETDVLARYAQNLADFAQYRTRGDH